MKRVAFYLLGIKGYDVVKKFIDTFGNSYIEYVVSDEDKNIQKDFYMEIKELAQENGFLFLKRSEKSQIAEVERNFNGYKFAISWKWMIKNFEKLIVLHDSLLPKYRGFAPLVNSLKNGEKEIGVTALFASSEYDCGDIISQEKITISYPIKIKEAIEKITPLYFKLVKEIFNKIYNDEELIAVKQNENEATYSLWLDDKDYFIDWSLDAEYIKRFIDAVGYPYDGAKSYLNGKIVKILDSEVCDDVNIINREKHLGKVIFYINGKPTVICGKKLLVLEDIRD